MAVLGLERNANLIDGFASALRMNPAVCCQQASQIRIIEAGYTKEVMVLFVLGLFERVLECDVESLTTLM